MLTPPDPTQVSIRVDSDDDARRISAVLVALGYAVVREVDNVDNGIAWIASELTRRHKLTSRESEILQLVLDGTPTRKIAETLDVSKATVKWHLHNVFAKTGVNAREELTHLALQCLAVTKAPAKPAEQAFDVVLAGVGGRESEVIKALRLVIEGLGPNVAKRVVESAPVVVLRGASKVAAEAAKTTLEGAGAVVSIVAGSKDGGR